MSLTSCVHNSYRVVWSVPPLDKSQMLSLVCHVSRVIRASCHNIMKCMIWHENNQYLYMYLQRFMPEVLFINRGGVNERPNESPRCAIAPFIFLRLRLFLYVFWGGGVKVNASRWNETPDMWKGFNILQSHCMKYSSIPEGVACFFIGPFLIFTIY